MRIRLSFEIKIERQKPDEPEQHYHPDTESSIERAEPFVPYFTPGSPEEKRTR